MPVVLFNSKVLSEARVNLRAASGVGDATVDIGGYHFECGARDFDIWSRLVKAELDLELAWGTRLKLAGVDLDLADIYVRMRERAFELAKGIAKTRGAVPAEVSESLNAFMTISKPDAQHSHTAAAAPASVSVPIPTEKPVNAKEIRATVSGPGTVQHDSKPGAASEPHISRDGSAFEPLLAELHSYIGLAGVKKDIDELANSISVDRARRTQGLRVPDRSLHMVFYGKPGTGKTTVARLVAQIYKDLGILTKGHLVSTDRAGLVASYVGQTAPKVTAVVREAIGGVLFIDEAYSLAPPDSQNDFGQEAIQQLLLLMENHRKELIVIAAGYPEEMARFLDANPGLNSRFTKKLHFEDYSPDELVQIFEKMCRENDYRLHDRARVKLLRTVQAAHSNRDKTFGNARLVRNLFEEATKNLANRVVTLGLSNSSALIAITEEDIPDAPVPPLLTNPNPRSRVFPDFGSYLASKGMRPRTAIAYPSFDFENLVVLGPDLFLTTKIATQDGGQFCAVFNFQGEILEQILARAPEATAEFLKRNFARDRDRIQQLTLPLPISAGVVAKLGDKIVRLNENNASPEVVEMLAKAGVGDDFIPLTVANVLGTDEAASSEPLPEIAMTDVKAIRVYCRHLAKEWWNSEPRQVAICDSCNSPVLRDEGFITDSYLRCEACFDEYFDSNTPDEALGNLRSDADYYGEGLLDEARRFAGIRPRK